MTVGESVFRKARVYTRFYGSAKIRLRDQSELMITPNSSIIIDDFVFSGGGDNLALRLTKGAVRMISGRIAKDRVLANTSIAAIGIRGTQFWLDVDTPDLLRIWVQDGSIVARPVGTDQEFVFDAPLYAECTTTTCYVAEPPELPEAFPRDPRQR